MRKNYPQMLKWMGLSEGGYVDHPDDPGGKTDRGITQRTYDAWNVSHGLPKVPVRGIDKATANEILAKQYFDTVRADVLPSGLDYAVADYSVNSGPGQAAKDLQRCLGVSADGIIGAHTLAAVAEADVQQVIIGLCERRLRFMKSLKHWPTFKNGWKARVMGGFDGVQDFDNGVVDRAWRMVHSMDKNPGPLPHGGRAEGQASLWRALIALITSLFNRKGTV